MSFKSKIFILKEFVFYLRFCSAKTKYIAKIDDDSIIDFDKLVTTLEDMGKEENGETISCPSVTRNRKVWRHSEAKLMGKWAHSEAEIPGKYLPASGADLGFCSVVFRNS